MVQGDPEGPKLVNEWVPFGKREVKLLVSKSKRAVIFLKKTQQRSDNSEHSYPRRKTQRRGGKKERAHLLGRLQQGSQLLGVKRH